MSITHRASLRDELCNLTVDKIDLGSAYPNGRIVLFDGANAPCVVWELPNPAMLDSSAGIAYPNGAIADDAAPAVGQIPVRFEVQDRDHVAVWGGSVGVSGDWTHNGAAIAGPMSCQGFYYRAPL